MRSFFQKSLQKMSKQLGVWNETVLYDAFSSLANWRLLLVATTFLFFFFLICVRLVDIMVFGPRKSYNLSCAGPLIGQPVPRADIIDRNGNILATHLVTASVYANTYDIVDKQGAAQQLQTIFPEYTVEELEKKLTSGKSFIWIARHLTPKKQKAVQYLGIPGIYLKKDYKRVYPYSNLASHIIGFCDIDGRGIAGVENAFDGFLWQSNAPLRLSIDIRVQHILLHMLSDAIKEFSAIGGNAILMHVKTGEIIGMESLPTFDLNHPGDSPLESRFNRNTLGINEPGSVLKILNVAIALESGRVSMNSQFDATEPVRIGRFLVTDFRGKNRVLSLREAFLYSSNIAAIKILQQFGGAIIQRKYFEDFGLFDPASIELPEMGRPIYPKKWTEATAMSSSYGYGIAVSPLKILTVVNGIINDGVLIEPTIICNKKRRDVKIVSRNTSKIIREFMRDVVLNGTGRRANVAGYEVFAKTGTSYKNKNGRYSDSISRMTSIVCGFPFHEPQYVLIVMLDAPKPTEKTFGYATAGWNVTPYAAKIIERIAPLLGISISPADDSVALGQAAEVQQAAQNHKLCRMPSEVNRAVYQCAATEPIEKVRLFKDIDALIKNTSINKK
ncbi:MAG: penicillin-binding protein 2 [Holosporales bacterium]|jgi:cell division protein FtsI (penicillin-binding protein 3)|nr:penicillin-binding protein 2 [Holosporales bacterium]